jgi:hypothetical protein
MIITVPRSAVEIRDGMVYWKSEQAAAEEYDQSEEDHYNPRPADAKQPIEIKVGDTFYVRTPDGLIECSLDSLRPARRTKVVCGQWVEMPAGSGYEVIAELSSVVPKI